MITTAGSNLDRFKQICPWCKTLLSYQQSFWPNFRSRKTKLCLLNLKEIYFRDVVLIQPTLRDGTFLTCQWGDCCEPHAYCRECTLCPQWWGPSTWGLGADTRAVSSTLWCWTPPPHPAHPHRCWDIYMN